MNENEVVLKTAYVGIDIAIGATNSLITFQTIIILHQCDSIIVKKKM